MSLGHLTESLLSVSSVTWLRYTNARLSRGFPSDVRHGVNNITDIKPNSRISSIHLEFIARSNAKKAQGRITKFWTRKLFDLSLPLSEEARKCIDIESATNRKVFIQFDGNRGFDIDQRKGGEEPRSGKRGIIGEAGQSPEWRGHAETNGGIANVMEAEIGEIGDEIEVARWRIRDSSIEISSCSYASWALKRKVPANDVHTDGVLKPPQLNHPGWIVMES